MARVLVVEDDADTAELIRDLLSARGHAVEVASDGVPGLVRAARRRFGLILLDVGMAGLSGLAVQRAVRDFSDVPVIVLSAGSGPWMADALRSGATACMPKPFPAIGLADLVDSLLEADGRTKGWPRDVRALGPGDLRRLERLSAKQLDALPFGVIRLDREGRIRAYNAYEARAAREEAKAVLGVPFAGLAPCTRVKSFMKALARVRAGEAVDEVIRFTFPRHGAQALVSVRLFARSPDEIWLFVAYRSGPKS